MTLEYTISPSVRPSILASLLLLNSSSDLKYGPCLPARDLDSCVSGLVVSLSVRTCSENCALKLKSVKLKLPKKKKKKFLGNIFHAPITHFLVSKHVGFSYKVYMFLYCHSCIGKTEIMRTRFFFIFLFFALFRFFFLGGGRGGLFLLSFFFVSVFKTVGKGKRVIN